MKTGATTGFVAARMESRALETEHFDRLVEQYRPRVLRFVFAMVRDMDLAESLTQDCFWKAYRNRHGFRGDCTVNSWLLRIAINLVRDNARKRRFQFWRKAERVDTEVILNWPETGLSPEERTALNEQVAAVWAATGALSERQRTIFLLRFIEEQEVGEIAQATGLTESTVNVHLTRAVRNLRKRLGTGTDK
jgi:RNA polymerase sigma-70 factor (ECF subfamily)